MDPIKAAVIRAVMVCPFAMGEVYQVLPWVVLACRKLSIPKPRPCPNLDELAGWGEGVVAVALGGENEIRSRS